MLRKHCQTLATVVEAVITKISLQTNQLASKAKKIEQTYLDFVEAIFNYWNRVDLQLVFAKVNSTEKFQS